VDPGAADAAAATQAAHPPLNAVGGNAWLGLYMNSSAPSDARWTFDQVQAALEQRFASTPYAVTRKGDRISVQADLADKTYLTWAWAHHVNEIRGVEIAAKKHHKATTRDYSRSVAVSVGSAVVTGEIQYSSGRQWSLEKNIEWGVGLDGSVGRQVDYTFSSSEIQKPVNEILKQSGWYAGPLGNLPTDARIGAAVALFTVAGLVIAGLVLLIVAVT